MPERRVSGGIDMLCRRPASERGVGVDVEEGSREEESLSVVRRSRS